MTTFAISGFDRTVFASGKGTKTDASSGRLNSVSDWHATGPEDRLDLVFAEFRFRTRSHPCLRSQSEEARPHVIAGSEQSSDFAAQIGIGGTNAIEQLCRLRLANFPSPRLKQSGNSGGWELDFTRRVRGGALMRRPSVPAHPFSERTRKGWGTRPRSSPGSLVFSIRHLQNSLLSPGACGFGESAVDRSEVFQQHYVVGEHSLGEGERSAIRGRHDVGGPSQSHNDFVQDSRFAIRIDREKRPRRGRWCNRKHTLPVRSPSDLLQVLPFPVPNRQYRRQGSLRVA